MNTEPQETQLIFWQWGRDTANSVVAVKLAEDGYELEPMAKDLITGKVQGTVRILAEFANRTHELYTDTLYHLAKRFPKCRKFTKDLVSRYEVPPEMLDEFADLDAVKDAIARHRNTAQHTLDRMVRQCNLDTRLFRYLRWHVSVSVLEELALQNEDIGLAEVLASRTSHRTLLLRFAHHEMADLRRKVVENPALDKGILNGMACREENRPFLPSIARRLTDGRILDQLAESLCDEKWPALAEAILQNPCASDMAKTIAVLTAKQQKEHALI